MICDIFGGPQHGADDEVEFGHGMDPDVIEKVKRGDLTAKACG